MRLEGEYPLIAFPKVRIKKAKTSLEKRVWFSLDYQTRDLEISQTAILQESHFQKFKLCCQ